MRFAAHATANICRRWRDPSPVLSSPSVGGVAIRKSGDGPSRLNYLTPPPMSWPWRGCEEFVAQRPPPVTTLVLAGGRPGLSNAPLDEVRLRHLRCLLALCLLSGGPQ